MHDQEDLLAEVGKIVFPLYRMKADQVIYEEFETGIAFIFKTLQALGYPREFITQVLANVRERDGAGTWEISDEDEMAFGRLSVLADTKIEWIELIEQPFPARQLAELPIKFLEFLHVAFTHGPRQCKSFVHKGIATENAWGRIARLGSSLVKSPA